MDDEDKALKIAITVDGTKQSADGLDSVAGAVGSVDAVEASIFAEPCP